MILTFFDFRQNNVASIRTPYRSITHCAMSLLDIVSGHGVQIPESKIIKTILITWLFSSMLGKMLNLNKLFPKK